MERGEGGEKGEVGCWLKAEGDGVFYGLDHLLLTLPPPFLPTPHLHLTISNH